MAGQVRIALLKESTVHMHEWVQRILASHKHRRQVTKGSTVPAAGVQETLLPSRSVEV